MKIGGMAALRIKPLLNSFDRNEKLSDPIQSGGSRKACDSRKEKRMRMRLSLLVKWNRREKTETEKSPQSLERSKIERKQQHAKQTLPNLSHMPFGERRSYLSVMKIELQSPVQLNLGNQGCCVARARKSSTMYAGYNAGDGR